MAATSATKTPDCGKSSSNPVTFVEEAGMLPAERRMRREQRQRFAPSDSIALCNLRCLVFAHTCGMRSYQGADVRGKAIRRLEEVFMQNRKTMNCQKAFSIVFRFCFFDFVFSRLHGRRCSGVRRALCLSAGLCISDIYARSRTASRSASPTNLILTE